MTHSPASCSRCSAPLTFQPSVDGSGVTGPAGELGWWTCSGCSLPAPARALLIPRSATLAEAERLVLEHALAAHHGNKKATAIALGISRSALYAKLRRLGLEPSPSPSPPPAPDAAA